METFSTSCAERESFSLIPKLATVSIVMSQNKVSPSGVYDSCTKYEVQYVYDFSTTRWLSCLNVTPVRVCAVCGAEMWLVQGICPCIRLKRKGRHSQVNKSPSFDATLFEVLYEDWFLLTQEPAVQMM